MVREIIIIEKFIQPTARKIQMKNDYWNPTIETKPLKELKKLQLKRLKNIVKYVYDNNKFYHQRLKKYNIKTDNIKELKDITKLPFLTKQDLRDFYPFELICTELDDIIELHASSGTTGKPVVLIAFLFIFGLQGSHRPYRGQRFHKDTF